MNNNRGAVNIVKLAVILTLIIFILGIIVTIGVLFFSFKMMDKATSIDETEYDVSAEATVIDYRESSYSDDEGFSHDTYCPVYEYTYNGQTYVANGSISTSDKKYEVGESVAVRISSKDPNNMYDPNFNSETEYDNFKGDVGKMFLRSFLIGGLIFGGMILYIIIVVRRRKLEMENRPPEVHRYDSYIQDKDNNPYV